MAWAVGLGYVVSMCLKPTATLTENITITESKGVVVVPIILLISGMYRIKTETAPQVQKTISFSCFDILQEADFSVG